jgi:hypothetical protein
VGGAKVGAVRTGAEAGAGAGAGAEVEVEGPAVGGCAKLPGAAVLT